MSDGTISQSEIDALLSGVDVGGLSSGPSSNVNVDTATLGKFADGLKDKVASNLNGMTGGAFEIGAPTVEAMDRDQLLAKLPEMVVAVMADFNAGLKGDHLVLLAPEFAQKITSLVNKEDNAELDDMALSVIGEFISTHTGSEITDLSAIAGLASNPPEAVHVPKAMVRIPQGTFALFSYPLTLEGQTYTLWEAVSSDVAEGIAKALGGGTPDPAPATGGALNAADMASMANLAGGQPQMGGMGGMQMGGFQQQPMMGGMPMGGMQMPMGGGMQMGGMPMGMSMPNVQAVQYPNLAGGPTSQEQGNIGLIMDVNMEMTVELGRTKKQIKDILGMGEGTIIELDKLAGEPVDILVNHKPIAKGEVVVIDENFGVRVTEILSPMERVSDLR
ncbi:MAG: flagellar motor switch protein FliN [Treponema sp.]|uniref:flagellar motor switch protein FliN n=1 Tax=Treponema sp. TaxID=166 RepID=UPI002A90B8A2|nr:flagellar motor switch protein FliN [Treponema sp.]MDY6398615.1 flagellar motor switch protein FliN [Treponema sp.]